MNDQPQTQPVLLRPWPKTKTRRMELAQAARRHLDVFRRYAKVDQATDLTVFSLLDAEAAIQRALYLESGGRLGNLHASRETVANDTKRLRAWPRG